jgi:hypothetical protein
MKYVLFTLLGVIGAAAAVVAVMFHGEGNDVLRPGMARTGAPRPGGGGGGGGGDS